MSSQIPESANLETWRSDVVSAAAEVVRLLGGGGSAPAWKCVGRAQHAHGPGRLIVDLRGEPGGGDRLDGLRVAGSRGPDREATSFPVTSARLADGILELYAPQASLLAEPYVWTTRLSLGVLRERLRDGLQKLGEAPLSEALAQRRLAGPVPALPAPNDLTSEQADAYRACLSPGLRLVWGPPGTGKTRILARAVHDLVRSGKRVLLVATANVAVDNALQAIVEALDPVPGEVVRVGPPALAELAEDERVVLERLTTHVSQDVDAQRQAIEARLAAIAERDAAIHQLDEQLAGYDQAAYERATAWVEHGCRLEESEARCDALIAEHAAATATERDARRAAKQAHAEWMRSEQPRERLALAAEHDEIVEQRQLQIETIDAWLARQELAAETEMPLARALRGPRQRRTVARRLGERAELVDAAERSRDAAARLRAEASPIDDAHVEALDRRCHDAAAARAHATRAVARIAEHGSEQIRERDRLRRIGVPTNAARDYIAASDSKGWPAAHARRARLCQQRDAERHGEAQLRREHRELVDRADSLRKDAEHAVLTDARVVATTLSRSRARAAIAEQQFDVVLVDEAGAATLLEVLLATSMATTTSVLLGDFLQLGPVIDKAVDKSQHPAVQRWARHSCFAHFGIDAPRHAEREPGCVVLRHQFRFGPTLRELANEVVYEGTLVDGDALLGVPRRPDTEIVVLDVERLGDLALIHREPGKQRGWWLIGAETSRVLAELHLGRGESIGLISPYVPQSDATLAAIRNQEGSFAAPVGTVHAFQGREFDAVVFDLVDDGLGRIGEIGRGRRGGTSFEHDSRRLFGVAATRARSRLYLITTGTAIRRAHPRSPLGAVDALLRAGRIELHQAGQILGIEHAPAPPASTTIHADLSTAFRRFAEITDISDELSFRRTLHEQIAQAERTLWIWSPWVGARGEPTIPLIKAAVDRGVRVWISVRPDNDPLMRRPTAQRWLAALQATGATVTRTDVEHRKVIVVDETCALVGSFNPLSQRRSREVMLTLRGKQAVERLLGDLRDTILQEPPRCPSCDRPAELQRLFDQRQTGVKRWRCRACKRAVVAPQATR